MGKHENIHFSPFILQNSNKTPVVYGNVFFSCFFFFPFKDSLSKHEKMRKCHSLQSKKGELEASWGSDDCRWPAEGVETKGHM